MLVLAIDKHLKCKFTAEPEEGQSLIFVTKEGITLVNTKEKKDSHESKLLTYLVSKFNRVPGFALTISVIEAGIPVSAGLGSSAAYAACLSAAIASVANHITGDEYEASVLDDIIADGTNYLEQLQHGQASGCDAACILKGGCIAYQLKFPPEVTEITAL